MKVLKKALWITASLAGLAALALAPQASADILHCDDVIINCGSLCVGFDCVNGESFGFDTIRLKENNLRMHFEDTSTSASFPSNDWRLTANDSSNGGLNHFSIDDVSGSRTPFRIEAGARTNALYVEADGDIGIGTSNPAVDLTIKTGNTPTVRLEQDGTSGFTPQTWDLAGNEANFFIRDATNGSKLPFRIKPNTPTDTIYLSNNGAVGIGTTSPLQTYSDQPALHIKGNNTNAQASLGIGNDPRAPGECAMNLAHSNGQAFITSRSCSTNSGNEEIRFFVGATGEVLKVTNTGVDITGDLTVSGDCTETDGACADFVFQPGYQLASIEEHAESMWQSSHLPAVGPASTKGFSVGKKTTGILHELEVAHIYIEQLNEKVKRLEEMLEAQLEAQE